MSGRIVTPSASDLERPPRHPPRPSITWTIIGAVGLSSTPPAVTSAAIANGGTAGQVDKDNKGDKITIGFADRTSGDRPAVVLLQVDHHGHRSELSGNNVVTAGITDNGSNDTLTVTTTNAACGGSLSVGSVARAPTT